MKLNCSSITQFQQLVEPKDYRPATKRSTSGTLCKLAEHFQCDPATLTENQIRESFLFLRQHKHYKASPMKAAKYSLLCFYLDCVKVTGWTVFKEVRIAEPEVLPMVLSRAEVQAVLGAVREPRFHTCLELMVSLSQSMAKSTEPMSVSSVQMAFRLARAASVINTAATTHTLRHSYGRSSGSSNH